MGDQEHALEGPASLVGELEEARARHEPAVAQAAEERDPPLAQAEAGTSGEPDDLAGQVDEHALGAVGARAVRTSRPSGASMRRQPARISVSASAKDGRRPRLAGRWARLPGLRE